jgi:dihydroorotate dehydrogenase
MFAFERPDLPVHAFGLDFPNPVGMAAGYDKDGQAIRALACLGFGHIELGTVTPLSQTGNPLPRVFRLPRDSALINRMGFPNAGAKRLLEKMQCKRPSGVILGVNIGKGVDTPLDQATQDYLRLMRTFYAVADYLVVNVSSPNTIGLRRLQARGYLEDLLKAISSVSAELEETERRRVPILVKLSPDLDNDELEDAVSVVQETGMAGIIATNTTVDRSGLSSPHRDQTGGLSGAPLRARSTEVIRQICQLTGGALPIVGVGGVFSPEDAKEKLEAGATLIQLYTGLVYRGPGLVREILGGL